MDGCWWTCVGDAGGHLFVNEVYHPIGDERTGTELGIEYQGSSYTHRSQIGLSLHTAH